MDAQAIRKRSAVDCLSTLRTWIGRAAARRDDGAVAKLRAIEARMVVAAGLRPAPSWPAPDGYRHEAVEEGDDWRVVDPAEMRACRMMRCETMLPAVAKLFREGKRSSWWYYCPAHMYGRWVEGGKVMGWRVVPDAKGTT